MLLLVAAGDDARRTMGHLETTGLEVEVHVLEPGGEIPYDTGDVVVIASAPYPSDDLLRRLATPVILVSDGSRERSNEAAAIVDRDAHDELVAAIEVALLARRLREQMRLGFRELVETLPAAAYTASFDPSADFIYVSPRIHDLLGYWPREILGDSGLWNERLHPDDRDWVLKVEAEARAKGEGIDIEYRMIRRDGAVVWLHDQAQVVRDDAGRSSYFHGFLFDITNRKRAQQELTETEESISRMLASVRAIVWRAEIDSFRFTYVSPEAEELLGYPVRHWLEPDFWIEHIHEDDRSWVHELCATAARAGKPHEFEYRMIASDGRVIWLRDLVNVVTDGMGGRELVGVMIDVTDSHRVEDEVKTRARQQETLADLGQLALGAARPSRLFDEAVSRIAETLDLRYAEIVRSGDTLDELPVIASVGWEDDVAGVTTIPAGLRSLAGYTLLQSEPVVLDDSETETRFETRELIRQHGVVSAMSAVIRGADGPWGALVVHSTIKRLFTPDDVNFLRAAANVLSAALIRDEGQRHISFQSRLLQEVGTPIVVADREGHISYWNEAAVQASGFSVEEALGRNIVELLVPSSDRDVARDRFEALVNRGRVASEWLLRKKDGGSSLYHVTTSVLEEDGEVTGVIGVAVDISERKRMEREVRASEARFRSAFESSATGMVLVAPDGRWLEVNQAICDMLGYPRDEIIGRPFANFTHPDDVGLSEDQLARALAGHGDHLAFTKRYLNAEGGTIWADVHGALIKDHEGEPLHFVTQVVDITDRVKGEEQRELLEQQLTQAQKMEAVGRLAGGIAHDFNNLLSVIMNYSAFVDEDMPDGDPKKADIAEIRRASERAAVLVRQLLTFSRKEVAAPQVVDVNVIMREMSGLLQRTLGEDVRIDFDLDESELAAHIDVGQLEQILMNLVVNARDAMPTGGRIAVTTKRVASHVHLTVSDDGEGMAPEVLEHAFEPFFTTKTRGRGTGLGLAMVYGIVTGWGGRVWVESKVGLGTTVHVHIPEAETEVVAPRPGPSTTAPRAGGQERTILVVEDEDAVRDMIARILSRAGYEVLKEDSVAGALAVLREREVDVLLTDVVMPGGSGRDLVEMLEAEGRKPLTIYMSGYTHEIIAERGILQEGEILLQKPFSAEALLERIEEVLTAP